MYGIFVNEDGCPYAEWIVQRLKPIETRSRNTLKQLVGNRVAIISTRRDKTPMVVGYAFIREATYHTAEALEYIRDLTMIPCNSEYDCKGNGKWCYYMTQAEPCDPYPLPSSRINHGRSYTEF